MMKKLVLITLVSSLWVTVFAQDIPTDGMLFRTVNLSYGTQLATGFIVTHKGLNFIVTVKHIFKGSEKDVVAAIRSDTTWRKISGSIHFHINPLIDIAVIKPDNLEVAGGIPLTESSVALGDRGFFLGFPYGMRTTDKESLNNGLPFPLIKGAVLSGLSIENGVQVYFLDGHNNPGFSGGPVFFNDRTPNGNKGLQLVAVISAYINQKNQLTTPMGNFDYFENSGIVIATASNHILEIIDAIK